MPERLSQAIEAAQETKVRAYFALRRIKKPEAFYSWLLGIADRVAKETHRRNRQMATDYDVAQQQEDRPQPPVRQAVAELPDVYRQVILLRYSSVGSHVAQLGSHGPPVRRVGTAHQDRVPADARRSVGGAHPTLSKGTRARR